ncbi:hypothetical protein V6U90_01250 [Micromonospora sp. CPCC 206060]|uniref:hypothetical protein n=1 Tax=Micromonospora sp. CPCC 206060 TaxID=3122406 RepID=UPI002FF0B06D
MAHGEAEHGCAQGEPCRLGHHEQHPTARSPRRGCAGGTHDIAGRCVPVRPTVTGELPPERVRPHGPGEPLPARVEEEPTVPRQRTEEPEPGRQPQGGCRSELSGWAGAHRHGRVRPGSRRVRRERPPHRWC